MFKKSDSESKSKKPSKKSSSGSTGGLLKGRWTIWIFAIALALLAAFGMLIILSDSASRVTYYATVDNLPARTPINLSNVKKIEVNVEGKPLNALTEREINSGLFFTKIALPAGTPVVEGVVGGLTPITYNLPEGYVAASIQVPPDRAVAGKIKTGDYIDIAAVDGDVSKVVLQNIRVLDVTVNPSSISQASTSDASLTGGDGNVNAGPESQQVRSGIPQVYTLAVSPENFTKLALLSGSSVLLALSQNPAPSSLDAQSSLSEMFSSGAVANGGEGTENIFGELEPKNGGTTNSAQSGGTSNSTPQSTQDNTVEPSTGTPDGDSGE